VFCVVFLSGGALPSVAAPVLELYLNYNYGQFQFGDWGYRFEVFIPVSYDEAVLTLPGIEDLNAQYIGGSESVVSVKEISLGGNTVHQYVFGPGKVDLTFNYLLNGVREYGAFTGTLGNFRTSVLESSPANIGSGDAPVLGGVLDARTAQLFGLGQRISGGSLLFYFDNERLLLGQFGDDVREAAAYGGPLSLEVPEPNVALLLVVAGATLHGFRARRRVLSRKHGEVKPPKDLAPSQTSGQGVTVKG
jgi:hypothetical protein